MRTVRAVMGSDCGTVINPVQVAGQLEGGLSKGAGFALDENGWDAEGQLRSKGFMVDAKVAGVDETPVSGQLSTHFADTYEPTGPFGAKGIGEAATNPVPAPTPMPFTTRSASASTSCRSRRRRFWRR